MAADNVGIFAVGPAVANGPPVDGKSGSSFYEHNVLILSIACTGANARDTVDVTVWIYRANIDAWFPEATIGVLTVSPGDVVDRRVPGVFADRVWVQLSNVVAADPLVPPDVKCAVKGWSDRIS